MLEFDWFHKPTFSGCYLNYLSIHPNFQKKDVITGTEHYYFQVRNLYYKNMKFTINTLLNNDYPIGFIFLTPSIHI